MVNKAKDYWEANPNAASERQWTNDPIIAREVYLRISRGESEAHWLSWLFERRFAGTRFDHVLSAGCGTGDHEIAMARLRSRIGHIDAFDVSQASIELARTKAEADGLDGIHFFQAGFDDANLGRERYDLAVCSGSLHHVRELEGFLIRVREAMRPGAYFVANEYVGDCYNIYSKDRLALVNQILAKLPPEALARSDAKLVNPSYEMVMERDPSEVVRSKLIPQFLQMFFEEVDQRPFGGNLLHLVYPKLDQKYLEDHLEFRQAVLGLLVQLEDLHLSKGEVSDFCFFVCRKA